MGAADGRSAVECEKDEVPEGPSRHQRRLELCARAGLTTRQMVVAMLTWSGRTEARIAKMLRVNEKAVGETLVAATRKLEAVCGGGRRAGLTISGARTLLRLMDDRAWPEDPFADCRGDWTTPTLRSRPFGTVAEDLARPAEALSGADYLRWVDREVIGGEPVPARP